MCQVFMSLHSTSNVVIQSKCTTELCSISTRGCHMCWHTVWLKNLGGIKYLVDCSIWLCTKNLEDFYLPFSLRGRVHGIMSCVCWTCTMQMWEQVWPISCSTSQLVWNLTCWRDPSCQLALNIDFWRYYITHLLTNSVATVEPCLTDTPQKRTPTI